jgi:DNA repair exonuclease SbcCD ATPase subunit
MSLRSAAEQGSVESCDSSPGVQRDGYVVRRNRVWKLSNRQDEIRAHAQLQDQLKTAQQALTEANTRQETRNTALQQQISTLQKRQKAIQKPADILQALPQVLPLPEPLVLEQPQRSPVDKASAKSKPDTPSSRVILPVEDLKPLYDSAIACKECQVELAASQANLKDEQAKTIAMSRERDDALRVAKGGSVLRRVARAAKWFLIGAAAGAVAAKLAH